MNYIIIGTNRVDISTCIGLLFTINQESILLLFKDDEERNEFYQSFNTDYTDVLELEKLKDYYNKKYNTKEHLSFGNNIIKNIKYYMGLHF